MDQNAYTGTIKIFAGLYTPVDWLLCDGKVQQISKFPTLFSVIGNTFGGDGQTTFAVPDLQGRIPLGSGSGPSRTPRTLGAQGGSEQVALTVDQMASHSHALLATDAAATSRAPSPSSLLAESQGRIYTSPPANPTAMAAPSVSSTGGGVPHDNVQPSLCINHIICANGVSPSQANSYEVPFLAEIAIFGGNFAWQNWMPCEGQLISIKVNSVSEALFALMGTTYGGNGITTFAFPDLRGRVPMGPGFGSGLTGRYVGDAPGAPSVTLTVDNLPPHTHSLFASPSAGLGNDPGNAMLGPPFSGDNLYASPSGRPLVPLQALQNNSGGGQPHNNMQPSLPLTFMICVGGIFPPMF
jgi:microcystin-dependent protein